MLESMESTWMMEFHPRNVTQKYRTRAAGTETHRPITSQASGENTTKWLSSREPPENGTTYQRQ